MKIEMTPPYTPVTEMPYCCLPAVLQMVQYRRGLEYESQGKIGYQLGLIVPPEMEHIFDEVRTGPEPKAGYGTQTTKEEFSINNYLVRNKLPLEFSLVIPPSVEKLTDLLISHLSKSDDVIICYNSQLLFGDGDMEHVSLVQDLDTDTGDITIVDPAIGVPKHRTVNIDTLFKVLISHDCSDRGGLWIISSIKK